MSTKNFEISAPSLAGGYYSQQYNRKPQELSRPSQNVRLFLTGGAYTRPGYDDTGYNWNLSGKTLTTYRQKRYTLTWVAGGGKVKYRKDSDATIIDTGVAYTDGTTTTFSEYLGDVYVTNPTDGITRFFTTTLKNAVTSSDKYIDLETATGVRAPTNGNIRINGTNIAYTNVLTGSVSGAADNGSGLIRITTSATNLLVTGDSVTIASVGGTTEANGTWTVTVIDTTHFDLQASAFSNAYTSGGTWTLVAGQDRIHLTGTAGANYNAGEYAIVVHSLSSLPKGQKIEFWKESMNLIGVSAASTSNASRYTQFWSKFAAPTTWTNVYDFTVGVSSSAGYQLVGRAAPLTNLIASRDYLYLFTSQETYYIPVSGVDATTGGRPAQLLTPLYGTVNWSTAVDMGGFLVWLTSNKRILKSNVRFEANTYTLYPDEAFDVPLREELNSMDDDQSGARMFYWKKGKLLFVQVKLNTGQYKTYVYDNNLGVWLPPDTNKIFNDFMEINGDLYATAVNDHIMYKLETTTADNGANIDCIIAGGIFRNKGGVVAADWSNIEISAYLRRGTTAYYTSVIDGSSRPAKPWTLSGSLSSSTAGSSSGDVPSGDGVTGGGAVGVDKFKVYKNLTSSITPGREWQPVFETSGDGQWMEIDAWTMQANAYSDSLITQS